MSTMSNGHKADDSGEVYKDPALQPVAASSGAATHPASLPAPASAPAPASVPAAATAPAPSTASTVPRPSTPDSPHRDSDLAAPAAGARRVVRNTGVNASAGPSQTSAPAANQVIPNTAARTSDTAGQVPQPNTATASTNVNVSAAPAAHTTAGGLQHGAASAGPLGQSSNPPSWLPSGITEAQLQHLESLLAVVEQNPEQMQAAMRTMPRPANLPQLQPTTTAAVPGSSLPANGVAGVSRVNNDNGTMSTSSPHTRVGQAVAGPSSAALNAPRIAHQALLSYASNEAVQEDGHPGPAVLLGPRKRSRLSSPATHQSIDLEVPPTLARTLRLPSGESRDILVLCDLCSQYGKPMREKIMVSLTASRLKKVEAHNSLSCVSH